MFRRRHISSTYGKVNGPGNTVMGDETHPPQSNVSFCMTLGYLFVIHTGISPVAVHNKGDMLGDRSSSQDTQQQTLCSST